MAEVDTSSYLKPSAPKTLMDNVQQFGVVQQQEQSLRSGALTIDKQKLDLVNQRFGEVAKGFTNLIADPSLTKDKVVNYLNERVKIGYMPQEMANTVISQLPNDPAGIRTKLKQDLTHAMGTVEAMNTQFGTSAEANDNANTYVGVRPSPMNGGGFNAATTIPTQPPPTQPIQDTNATLPNGQPNPNYLKSGIIGPVGPAGPRPYIQGGGPSGPAPMPQQRPQGLRAAVAPPAPPPSPVTAPALPAERPANGFDDRFGGAFRNPITTAAAPGVAAATQAVGEQSGKEYAGALSRAGKFRAEMYPVEAALKGIQELGTKGTGPGTEGLNSIKSAIVTWLPNTDQKMIDDVSEFEQTRKYLTQVARSSGSTGTNDQLAAAFEANPSIKMSNAATENVLKSVIALKKMEQAQTLMFAKTGLPDNEFTKWAAQNQNQFDARAFGFDIMSPEAKKKLVTNLGKNVRDYQKFEKSLEFAHKAELIEPPAAR